MLRELWSAPDSGPVLRMVAVTLVNVATIFGFLLGLW